MNAHVRPQLGIEEKHSKNSAQSSVRVYGNASTNKVCRVALIRECFIYMKVSRINKIQLGDMNMARSASARNTKSKCDRQGARTQRKPSRVDKVRQAQRKSVVVVVPECKERNARNAESRKKWSKHTKN